jgi:hypothetical protein
MRINLVLVCCMLAALPGGPRTALAAAPKADKNPAAAQKHPKGNQPQPPAGNAKNAKKEQDGARLPAWEFTGDRRSFRGWQVAALSSSNETVPIDWGFTQAGVHFAAATNRAYLRGFGMSVPAKEAKTVRIECSVAKPAEGMQVKLLWTDGGKYADASSTSTPLAPIAEKQTVSIPVATRPNWRGTITGLQFEFPPNCGKVAVKSIRFE